MQAGEWLYGRGPSTREAAPAYDETGIDAMTQVEHAETGARGAPTPGSGVPVDLPGRLGIATFFVEGISWKAVTAFFGLAVIWQLVSFISPVWLVPGVHLILKAFFEIVTTWELLSQGLISFVRLIAAILASVIVGVPIGLFMGLSANIDDYVRPIIKFIMGVPALNWVIIVIIWFSATELRIGFVLLMICAPITIFNVYDGIRSIDQKTTDMVKTFGANSWQMIRILLWPYVKSFAFTATKINVGVGVRVVIVAELVGAPSGIGKELDLAKSLFEMPLILAWTLWMIIVLLLLETVVEWLEGRVLKWRVEEGGKM
ncbi:MAG: ABC transporter permease subunit [Nitrospinota bacterium]|nr:ABC transporter permease subunit [Nitrospinota bacterium]